MLFRSLEVCQSRYCIMYLCRSLCHSLAVCSLVLCPCSLLWVVLSFSATVCVPVSFFGSFSSLGHSLLWVVLCIVCNLMPFSKISKDFANELVLVPRPRNVNKNQKQTIPTVLDLTDATRAIMEQHTSVVGLDKYLFQHMIDDQSNITQFL